MDRKMDGSKRTKSNELKKKIEQGIRRTGFDEHFIEAVKFHLTNISAIDTSNIKSQDEYCSLLMSKLFIDKIDTYPTKRFKCQINETSDWPLPVLPSEAFGEEKLPVGYRKKSFYKCLQVGDILDCRVASVLPTEYHLRVIHKYGTTRMLDDLSLLAILLKSKSTILQEELFSSQLIRVAVSDIFENKIYTTFNDEIVKLKKHKPQLGRISEEHLPSYVLDPPDPDLYSTYSDYLNTLPGFQNPILLDEIMEGFGIDPKGVYSFFPVNESLKSIDPNALFRESILNDIKHYTDLAIKNFDNKDIPMALNSVEKAINIFPKKNEIDKVELSKLYEIRGRIYEEMEKPKMNINALNDWVQAYTLDPTNVAVKQHLSRCIFLTANKYYRDGQYEKSSELAKHSSTLDENNIEALALLEHLKEKHPEVFVNLDEESLPSLQEKKKEIVNELQKFKS